MKEQEISLSCRCGQVKLTVAGKPIISAECLCSDCQSAGLALQALPGAPEMLDSKGATRFVLYRKDRVCCKHGEKFLKEHRLSGKATTRRVIAVCCDTPVFLEFLNGHWLSLYGGLWSPASLPPLELRTMTRSRSQGVVLPDDVPNPATHTLTFYGKLFSAWAAMRFRSPVIDYVNGVIKLP